MEGIEIWKDISGYEGLYQVSNLGRVKSLARYRSTTIGKDRWYKEKILNNNSFSNGYLFVDLRPRKEKSCFLVHRLVAKEFIPNPSNKKTVNHKDGNRTNNNVSNLEWNTSSENMYHARTQGNAKFCYIEKPTTIYDIQNNKYIKFKNQVEVCRFFNHKNNWIGARYKRIGKPFEYRGYMIGVDN